MKKFMQFIFQRNLSYATFIIYGTVAIVLMEDHFWLGLGACIALGAFNDIMADLTA